MTPTTARDRARSLSAVLKNPGDVWLVSTVVAWMISLSLLKRVLPLQTLVRFMWRPAGVTSGRPVERVESIVGRLDRLSGGNCLSRSLIVYRLLSRAGADPILVVGFANEGRVVGHTWVQVQGRPLLDDPGSLARYTTLVSFGANGQVTE